jgi:hypothetical protein
MSWIRGTTDLTYVYQKKATFDRLISSNFSSQSPYILLNDYYSTASNVTSGVINIWSGSAVTGTITAFGTNTMTTGSGLGFVPGDIILIKDSFPNDGIFEVLTYASTLITINTSPSEDFSRDYITGGSIFGTVTKVNIGVNRFNAGSIEDASGDNAPLTYLKNLKGPVSSTDRGLALFDGIGGDTVISSTDTLSSGGLLTLSGGIELPATSSLNTGTLTQAGSLLLHTFGTRNTFVKGGNLTLSGADNVSVSSLLGLTSGTRNTGVGRLSGDNITGGDDNTFIGYNTGGTLSTADESCGFGSGCLANSNGSKNTASGFEALTLLSSGINQTAIGHSAGSSMVTANDGVSIGFNALNACTVGQNTAIGASSAELLTTALRTCTSGYKSLSALLTGHDNTAHGFQSGLSVTGSRNSLYGSNSAIALTTAVDCCSFGANSLTVNTGSNVIAVGSGAGSSATTGDDNMYFGNVGVATESNTIRVGNSTDHSSLFLSGAYGVTPGGTTQTMLLKSDGQVGTSSEGTFGTGASTDNALVRWHLTSGTLMQNSNAILTDAGTLTLSSTLFVDTITEKTVTNGVDIELVILKDGNIELVDSTSTTGKILFGADFVFHNYGTRNLFLGGGNFTLSGTDNVSGGSGVLDSLTNGSQNTGIGINAGTAINSGNNSICIGFNAGMLLTTGDGNICINHDGVAAESNTIRFGTSQTRNFQAGIWQITPASSTEIMLIDSSGQIGSQTNTAFYDNFSRTVVSATPYTALNTDHLLGVTFASATVINLPAASTKKRYTIVDERGTAATNIITVTPNGADTIIGALTYVINGNYNSINIYSNGGTEWFIA